MKKLFIFEGPDGCGKTTQIQMLEKKLISLGKKVKVTREPGGTEIGEKIREILLTCEMKYSKETEAYLYAASRRALSEEIDRLIEEGYTVICDRSVISSMVYQTSEEFDSYSVKELNKVALKPLSELLGRNGRIRETEFIFLDVSLETYKSRNKARIESRGLDNIESRYVKDVDITKMLKTYYNEASKFNAEYVNANRSLEEVHASIIELL